MLPAIRLLPAIHLLPLSLSAYDFCFGGCLLLSLPACVTCWSAS
jgi:hypothetical protein